MASFLRSGSIYVGAAAMNAVIPFLALPPLLRALGPEEFGKVGVYLALINVATVIAGLSVHGVISVVHFRDGPQAVPAYIRGAMRTVAFTGVPLLLCSLLFASFFERLTGLPGFWAWTIALIAMAQFVVSLAMAVFQAREQPLRYAALQIGVTGAWVALSVLLVCGANMDWTGRATGQFAAVVTMALVALHLLRREGLLSASAGTAPLSTLLRFGLPLVPHSLAGAVMAGADRLLLSSIGSAEMAGQYFAAFQICAVLTVGAAAINQAWVPWIYRRLAAPSRSSAVEIVRATAVLNAMLLLAALLLALGASSLVGLIAGERYVAAIPVMRWLAPAAAFSGMYYFVTNHLFYHGKTGVLSTITVGTAVLQVSLLLVCVPRWGIAGAGFSALAAAAVYWLATWFAAHKVSPMPWIGAFRKEQTA